MPLLKKRKLALPQVRLEDVRIQNSLVSLYRRPDVLVEVSGVAGFADVKTTADDAGQGDLGRPVRSFYADMAALSPVLVTIHANRPRVAAEQVTRVTCEEDQRGGPSANADCRFPQGCWTPSSWTCPHRGRMA